MGLFDWKPTSGGILCIFGSHTFVPIKLDVQERTAVSHSSTESEIISLNAGLRLGGLLALELGDLIVSVVGSVSHVFERSGQPDHDVHKHHKPQKRINEDNEAVIKMIIKARSRTVRHVSRQRCILLVG